VTDTDEADVTQLDLLRKQANAAGDTAEKLTLLPFVIRAIVLALRRHPIFNASFDEQAAEIVYKQYINIAIGVQTERGLIAPVLRNVDQLTVPQIGAATRILTENARSAAFEVNDLRGGTFTISNAGAAGGSRFSTPIINPPQVAIVAIGQTRMRPWVVGDTIAPRLIMPLSFSFDHRIIDGAEEVVFQQDVIASLENPVRLM
jgi:pyruvate/2-oxoglutarate dehydrogenase complex dihydrolipoamide acyltransferase (E2) component